MGQKKFAYKIEEKIHSRKFSNKSVVRGKWFNFGGLVMKYGGWDYKPAIDGAKKTAGKCTLMGNGWCMKDPTLVFKHSQTHTNPKPQTLNPKPKTIHPKP